MGCEACAACGPPTKRMVNPKVWGTEPGGRGGALMPAMEDGPSNPMAPMLKMVVPGGAGAGRPGCASSDFRRLFLAEPCIGTEECQSANCIALQTSLPKTYQVAEHWHPTRSYPTAIHSVAAFSVPV